LIAGILSENAAFWKIPTFYRKVLLSFYIDVCYNKIKKLEFSGLAPLSPERIKKAVF